jgi:hypothetical protein
LHGRSRRAQQAALPVVGFVSGIGPSNPHFVRAFREGLAANGFVESRNLLIEYRWADGRLELSHIRAAVLPPKGAPLPLRSP